MSPLYNAINQMRSLKGEGKRFGQAFYQFSSKSLEHECNIFLPFYANPFSALLHFQLCIYSGVHNSRKLLLSRSLG